MVFPEDRYRHIDQLVQSYQSGERDKAGQELVELFTPLFNKYIRIIKKGIIDFNDYDSRHFISLFIADPKIRANLTRKFQSKKTRETAYKILYLINSACSQTFEEDLYQDFILIFLKAVNNCKPCKSFCAYIDTYFPYEAAQLVKKILNNPISTATIVDFSEDCCDVIFLEDYPSLDDKLPTNENDELSTSWIYGLTCSEAFTSLTPFERLILKMFYLDEITLIEIAKKVGLHRNSVGRRLSIAVEKVRSKTMELRMVTRDEAQKDR